MIEVEAQLKNWLDRALLLHQQGQIEPASALYESILKVRPGHPEALRYSGVIAHRSKNLSLALERLEKAVQVSPNDEGAHLHLGMVLRDLGRQRDAIASYDRALELAPDLAEAHFCRGVALKDLKETEAAVESYNHAIRLKPNLLAAHFNRGNALKELKRFTEAVESYDMAIRLMPALVEAHVNRGNALRSLKRYSDAIESYNRAIHFAPGFAEAFLNRGVTLDELNDPKAALEDLDRAVSLNPRLAKAYFSRGNVLRINGQYEAAIDNYRQMLEIEGGRNQALLRYAKMFICDWENFQEEVNQLALEIRDDEVVLPPFSLLALCDSSRLHLAAAQLAVKISGGGVPSPRRQASRSRKDKIRIGYYSADFHDHATMYLMAGVFEKHDRSKFELVAFSLGPDMQDGMRRRAEATFDRFIDARLMADDEVARMSQELEIDIAVDLKGFTQDNRLAIFSERCAPVQVSYLGYPGTTGAPFVDYVIADKTVIPPDSRQFYVEQVVYLPHSYQANDNSRQAADSTHTRADCGLPADGFVFCCFNNNYKITPITFDIWMRILDKVQGSVLWLLADHPAAMKNLRREARSRGIDDGRLIFAERMPNSEHLSRHRLADLFLDTWPYNAHTTASDALWAGLPVLTCPGESFASRVGASLLTAIGLNELIATSQDEYMELAIRLASDPVRLQEIRRKLALNRLTQPLFDTALFTRHLESAYAMMYERHVAGLSPIHMEVPC
jgi:predicted O-linked N-acetylglucosamine transferase (SPINDLY family)